MLTRLGLAALIAAMSLAACGGDADDKPKGAAVEMKLIAFRPDALTIDAGTAVTWRQFDAGAHTVTSGTVRQDGGSAIAEPDGEFESGEIAMGDTYRRTFAKAGTYPYFCAIHPATMRGQITVT